MQCKFPQPRISDPQLLPSILVKERERTAAAVAQVSRQGIPLPAIVSVALYPVSQELTAAQLENGEAVVGGPACREFFSRTFADLVYGASLLIPYGLCAIDSHVVCVQAVAQ